MPLRKFYISLGFLWGLPGLVLAGAAAQNRPSIAELRLSEISPQKDISEELRNIESITGDKAEWLEGDRVVRLYRAREFRPVFITNENGSRLADLLLSSLERSASHGLPFRYHLETVDAALLAARHGPAPWWSSIFGRGGENARSIARLDALLTDRYLAFASDLNGSHTKHPVQRRDTEPGGSPAAIPEQRDTVLVALVAGPPLPVEAWAPTHPQYVALRKAWNRYNEIAGGTGWPGIMPGETIRPGAHDSRVPQIRARIERDGDGVSGQATSPVNDPFFYDAALVERVREFQATHGLDPDGSIGKGTVAEMNVTAADRLRQIEVTLERWRDGPRGEPPHRVEVNVPGMMARFYHAASERLALRAVVGSGKQSSTWKGKSSRAETPELVDQIETIEVNPRWYIPEIIVRTELLAKEKRKPGFLDKGGYEWYDPKTGQHGPASGIPEADWSNPEKRLNLRQKAGRENALGRIKFVFHNRYAVYLHDTPEKNLFSKARRNFSHGCVRVENPAALAESLIAYSRRKPPRPVAEMMADTAHVVLTLKPPVPIWIIYRTAWAEPNGTVMFLPDIYGTDPEIERRLFSEATAGSRRPLLADNPPEDRRLVSSSR